MTTDEKLRSLCNAAYSFTCNLSDHINKYGNLPTHELRKQFLDMVRAAEIPIDMILHCPHCGVQHVDRDEGAHIHPHCADSTWRNPPHKSHLCHRCGFIWRPSDFCTNGVERIGSRGKKDTSPEKRVEYVPTRVPGVYQRYTEGFCQDDANPGAGSVYNVPATRKTSSTESAEQSPDPKGLPDFGPSSLRGY